MGKNLYDTGIANKIGASNPNFVAERRGRRSLRKDFDAFFLIGFTKIYAVFQKNKK